MRGIGSRVLLRSLSPLLRPGHSISGWSSLVNSCASLPCSIGHFLNCSSGHQSLVSGPSFSRFASSAGALDAIRTNPTGLLHRLDACLAYIRQSALIEDSAKEKCVGLVTEFGRFVAANSTNKNISKGSQSAFRRRFLKTLFLVSNECHRGKRGPLRDELAALNAVLDQIPAFSPLKINCFVGAVLLTNGQPIAFVDYLKVRDASLDSQHIEYLEDIASAAGEPAILESLLDLPPLLPPSLSVLARVHNSLALIYGKASRLDQLESLCERIRRLPPSQRMAFKHVLHRCAHFFRCSNQKMPNRLYALLKEVDNPLQAYRHRQGGDPKDPEPKG